MVWRIAMAAFLAVTVFLTNSVHARIPPLKRGGQEAFIPKPEFAKLVSLGFHAVLADYYWLQAVQLVGEQDSSFGAHSEELIRLIDVVTTVDPWVSHPYRFAAVWLTQDRESVLAANRFLARAIEYHPRDWRNYFYKGFNHFFYLNDHETAADLIERASKLGAPKGYGPPPTYLPRLVARLRSQSGDLEAAEVFLRELVEATPDEAAKAVYQSGLDEIEIERKAQFLDRARKAYNNLFGRDIDSVDDLVSGPNPMLELLPDAEPSSLPAALRRGARWILDEERRRIVSSYYGRRYEIHVSGYDRRKLENW